MAEWVDRRAHKRLRNVKPNPYAPLRGGKPNARHVMYNIILENQHRNVRDIVDLLAVAELKIQSYRGSPHGWLRMAVDYRDADGNAAPLVEIV